MPWGAMRLMRRLTTWRLHSAHTHRDEIRRFLELTATATKEGHVNRLRILRAYDIRRHLEELRLPALFLAAEHDRLVPSIAQARFRRLECRGRRCVYSPAMVTCAWSRPA